VRGRPHAHVRLRARQPAARLRTGPGRYHFDVVDLPENPRLAAEGQVAAVPTLVWMCPPSIRRIVGDLCAIQRLLADMQLRPVQPG